MNQENWRPETRNENIVIQEMNKEILIYDLNTNKAFCLNETSAIIYQLCDGTRNIHEIVQSFNQITKNSITDDLIWLALDKFKQDNLLEDDSIEINFNGLSRLQVIKKVGLASLIALPLVSSVVAPTAGMAASLAPTNQPLNAACSAPSQCASGNCFNNSKCCAPGTSRGLAPGENWESAANVANCSTANQATLNSICSNLFPASLGLCCNGNPLISTGACRQINPTIVATDCRCSS